MIEDLSGKNLNHACLEGDLSLVPFLFVEKKRENKKTSPWKWKIMSLAFIAAHVSSTSRSTFLGEHSYAREREQGKVIHASG